MNRPKNWYELPYSLMETIADNCDLEYDPYESSHADALHGVLCDPTYNTKNNDIIQHRYENMSNTEVMMMVEGHIKGLKSQINKMEKLIES